MTWPTPPNQDADTHPDELPLFVYGTLRAGGESHQRLTHILTRPPHTAHVPGTLAICTAGSWPLLLPGTTPITGDILTVHTGTALWEVLCGWELAWGYSLRWLPTLENPDTRVLACVWEWPHLIGDTIPSGDWLQHTATQRHPN